MQAHNLFQDQLGSALGRGQGNELDHFEKTVSKDGVKAVGSPVTKSISMWEQGNAGTGRGRRTTDH